MNVEGKIIRERVVLGDVRQVLVRLNQKVHGQDLLAVCLYEGNLISFASVEESILEHWEVEHVA